MDTQSRTSTRGSGQPSESDPELTIDSDCSCDVSSTNDAEIELSSETRTNLTTIKHFNEKDKLEVNNSDSESESESESVCTENEQVTGFNLIDNGKKISFKTKNVTMSMPVDKALEDDRFKDALTKNFKIIKMKKGIRLIPKQDRRRSISSESEGSGDDDSDSSWQRVEHKKLKSLPAKASLQEFLNASDAQRVQSKLPKDKWTKDEITMISSLSTFFAQERLESEESKNRWRVFDKRSKKFHNSYDLARYYLSVAEGKFDRYFDEARLLWIHDVMDASLPGCTDHLYSIRTFLERLQEPDPTSPEPKSHPKNRKAKGGKAAGFELHRRKEWEGPLDPEESSEDEETDDRRRRKTDKSDKGKQEEEPPLFVKLLREWYNSRLGEKQSLSELLPERFRVRKGDLFVVATLFEQEITNLSDREHQSSPFIYSMELFKKEKIRNKVALRPYHEIDPEFPRRPLLINATQLVELAGRRWAGRPDLEAKRSLLSHGFENPFSLPFLAKLNLPRNSVVKILDVVLGDDADCKVWLPEPIITGSTNFKAVGGFRRARIFVRPGYEKKIRAYSLLNMYCDHFVPWITKDTLEQAVDKRLTCCFSQENWNKFQDKIIEVAKTLNFGDPLDEVQPNDFVRYAKEAVRRKNLTEGQGCEWLAAADYIKQSLEDGKQDQLLDLLEYCLRVQMGIFIKDEEYAKWGTTLRFIVNPVAFVKVFFGTAFRDVEERLYFDDRSVLKKHLIKGLREDQVKTKIMGLKPGPDEKIAETDYSAFEGSQSAESLDVEYRVYLGHCQPASLRYKIINLVRRCNESDISLSNKYFRVHDIPMRWSGMPNTACGNVLMNYVNLVACCGVDPTKTWFIEGDDGILIVNLAIAETMMANSLYPLTLQLANNWNELSFCGHHYDLEGIRHISRDEILRKVCTYFSPNPIGRRKAWELLWMRFLSLQISYPGNPYLNELIDEANREYSDVRQMGIRRKTIDQWYRDNWWRFENRGHNIDLPGDTTKIPKFHETYLRCIKKADQRGEVLTMKKKVSLLNYSLHQACCDESRMPINCSNFLLSVADGLNRLCHRVRGEHPSSGFYHIEGREKPRSVIDKEEARENYHDHLVDRLNQSSWYRKLVCSTGWRWLCPSQRQSLFLDRLEYSGELDAVYTAAYNHEMRKYQVMTRTARKWLESHGRVVGYEPFDVEIE